MCIRDRDITTTIGGEKLDIPILGAAMDGVIDPRMAVEMGRLGGWGVLNLEGLFTRYDDPYSIIEEMVNQPREKITDFIQEVYRVPIKEHLVGERIQEIKREGVKAVASLTPSKAETLSKVAQEAGLDILVIQSTVTTLRYHSSTSRILDLEKFCRETPIPVILGNCATYKVALDLMKAGAACLLYTSKEILA